MRKGVIRKLMIVFFAFVMMTVLSFGVSANENEPVEEQESTALAIVTQPADYSGPVGEYASFSVEAEGEGLKYQWQVNKTGSWTNCSINDGGKTATLTQEIKEARNGWKYQCIITDGNGASVTSDTATLTVTYPFYIINMPANYSGPVGDYATFTVEATGKDLTYQWQVWKNGAWANCSKNDGSKTATLTQEIKDARNGWVYHCVITDAFGEVLTTDDCVLSISSPFSIVTQPQSFSGPVGEFATFTVETEGEDLKYQWQVNKTGSWVNCSINDGGKTPTLTQEIKDARNGWVYHCVITNAYGETLTTDDAVLTVSHPIIINTQPSNYSGPVGEYAEFTVEAEGEGLKYQWMVNKTGTWVTCSLNDGAKTATLRQEIKDSRNGWVYHCVITNSYGETAQTDDVVLTVTNENFVNVTLDANGGYFGDDHVLTRTIPYEKGYFLLNNPDVFEVPFRDGYEFRGWLDASGKAVNNVDIEEDVTYYADWVKLKTVTFDANGGQFDNGETTKVEYTVNNYMYISQNEGAPYREGYVFTGWLFNNQIVTRRVPVNGDIVLTASWEEGVVITYRANGGYWYDENDQPFDEMPTYELKGRVYYVGCEEPVREGYKFAGWRVNGQVPGRMYADSSFYVDATWKKELKVTFNANGGAFYYYNEELDEDIPSEDPTIVRNAEEGRFWVEEMWPYIEGSEFLGWSTDPNATTAEYCFDYDLTEDTTFYAIYAKRGVIHYDGNGGYWGPDDYPEEQKLVCDEYINVGDYYYIGYGQPRRDGYQFICWVDKDGNDMNDAEILIDEDTDITVYAKWSKRIKVIFDANEGSWDFEQWINDVYQGWQHQTTDWWNENSGDEFFPEHWGPSREGYEFLGWADANGNLYEESIILPEEDITFYAKWLKLVKVTYDSNGGTFRNYDEEKESETTLYRYYRPGVEEYLEGNRPDLDGYEFIQWALDPNDYRTILDNPTTFDEDVTLYAFWYQPKTITYVTSIGYWHDYDEEQNENIDIDTFTRTAGNQGDYYVEGRRPDARGYDFVGYSLTPNSNKVDYYPNDRIEFVGEDITLYAVWKKLPTVTYDAGDGEFWPEENEYVDYDCRDDRKYHVAVQDPYLEGYDLIGWVDGEGNDVTGQWLDLEAGVDYRFYAVWELSSVQITFDANGGAFRDGMKTNTIYADYNKPFDLGNEWPEREGYEFLGWNTDPNATTGWVECTVTLDDDVTYYAIWEKVTTIYLDAGNEGWFEHWVDDYYDEENEEYVEGHNEITGSYLFTTRSGSIILPFYIDRPTSENYVFDGWVDADGRPVTNFTVGDEDIILYATWVRQYDIVFDAGEGAFSNGDSQIVNSYDEGEFLLINWFEEPYREGYAFAGWAYEGEYISYLEVDNEYVLEALWVPLG